MVLLVTFATLINVSATKVSGANSSADSATTTKPPAAPVRAVVDDYFGVKVSDPYRYMENLQGPEVAAWFKAQAEYTHNVLAAFPGRAALLARIKVLDEGAPSTVEDVRRLPGDRYFYRKRLASEEVSKLYTRTGLTGSEKVLIDPMKSASASGSHYSISYYAPSFDGRYVAVGISAAGSEDAVIRVVDTQTVTETGDAIDRGRFGSP